MSFLLAISDFSADEGVYTASQIARLAPRLGYADLVIWDRGLHGYPRLRDELEFMKSPVRLHMGCRVTWRPRKRRRPIRTSRWWTGTSSRAWPCCMPNNTNMP